MICRKSNVKENLPFSRVPNQNRGNLWGNRFQTCTVMLKSQNPVT